MPRGLLTRKQTWRKAPFLPGNMRSIERKLSLPDYDICCSEERILKDEKKLESTKKVRFNCHVSVRFIPTTKEYCEENLQDHLWWSLTDYTIFKETTVSEIQLVLKLYPLLNATAALRLINSTVDENELPSPP
mmetsp:Transcript_30961/g.42580  ORF Transcript_30961/g.42580 Transcript_30961/m.42580 type:complete len:133 (+) Transcript_30961:41-439(+)